MTAPAGHDEDHPRITRTTRIEPGWRMLWRAATIWRSGRSGRRGVGRAAGRSGPTVKHEPETRFLWLVFTSPVSHARSARFAASAGPPRRPNPCPIRVNPWIGKARRAQKHPRQSGVARPHFIERGGGRRRRWPVSTCCVAFPPLGGPRGSPAKAGHLPDYSESESGSNADRFGQ